MVVPTEFPNANTVSQTWMKRKLVARIWAEIRRTSWTREIDQTLIQCWFLVEHWERTVSSSPLMKKDLTRWKDHVESTPYLEVRNHPAWEGGSVETPRWAQSWMWRSTYIKDVTVWRSWSNFFLRQNCFFGSHREWNQQIRDRNVRRNSCCNCVEQRYRETCREG